LAVEAITQPSACFTSFTGSGAFPSAGRPVIVTSDSDSFATARIGCAGAASGAGRHMMAARTS
jgi:hypothetical protein